MKRCIPPEMKEQADAAEKRLEDAIAEVLAALEGYLPDKDDFHRQMVALIDADKRKDR